jgi:hypothetical protein
MATLIKIGETETTRADWLNIASNLCGAISKDDAAFRVGDLSLFEEMLAQAQHEVSIAAQIASVHKILSALS